MKPVWYLLTFLFGALGILGALRCMERLATGAGVLAPKRWSLWLVCSWVGNVSRSASTPAKGLKLNLLS